MVRSIPVLLLLVIVLVPRSMLAASSQSDVYREAFAAFAKKYGKAYGSSEEREARFAAFKVNYLFVEEENDKGRDFVLALNEMSDWTSEEMNDSHSSAKGLGVFRRRPMVMGLQMSNVGHVEVEDGRSRGFLGLRNSQRRAD